MHILEVIILGIIQGLTEFIPISSSGHLVIAQNLFSGASDHLFLEFINVGTLAALLVYFRHKIVAIVKDIFINKKFNLARNIIITALPAGIIGYLLSDFINAAPFFGSLIVVTVALAAVGIVMVLLERFPKASKVASGEMLSPLRAFIIGIAQVFALIPGVSRSGTTIITGRLSGLDAKSAAEYSFLASLPIMIGVTLKIFVSDRAYFSANLVPLVIGNAVAFVAGMLAIGFLMKYLSKHSLAIFGWYRIGLAAVLALVLLLQWK